MSYVAICTRPVRSAAVPRLLILILVLAAVVLLALPGAARADEAGVVVGKRVFGALPCGTPTVGEQPFIGVDTLAGADPEACQILLNGDYASQMPADMRCTLVLHEYGHLAGHEHSARRDAVMYAEYQHADPRCIAAVRPFTALSRAAGAPGTSGTARTTASAARRRAARPSRR